MEKANGSYGKQDLAWGSPQPAWRDPPWSLTGRIVTAWCETPWQAFETMLSPELLPARTSTVRTRVRFYDLRFEALSERPSQALSLSEGPFRECSFAVPARHGEHEGELSLMLWTDSEIYQMWGRENFGWPIRLADMEFNGEVWTAEQLSGSEGEAYSRDSYGSIAVSDVRVGDPAAGDPLRLASGAGWIAPRLVTRRGRFDEDDREVLIIRPEVRAAGSRYVAEGHLRFDFANDHPLGALSGADTSAVFEVTDGFDIVVGGDVEVA